MRSSKALAVTTVALLFMFPASAFAAEAATETVPQWLSIAAGAVGLVTAVVLLVDAALLRRVSEGSIIADNIIYMMTSVVCLAFSMLLRWVVIFVDEPSIIAQASLGADLLVTAGMALLAVYVYRIRKAMTGYLRAARGLTDQSGEQHSEGEDVDGGVEG